MDGRATAGSDAPVQRIDHRFLPYSSSLLDRSFSIPISAMGTQADPCMDEPGAILGSDVGIKHRAAFWSAAARRTEVAKVPQYGTVCTKPGAVRRCLGPALYSLCLDMQIASKAAGSYSTTASPMRFARAALNSDTLRPELSARTNKPAACGRCRSSELLGRARSPYLTASDRSWRTIAAPNPLPPLAIALIGDWGAGKSSVMLQIQRRIDMLAEMSRNNPGLSVFASNIRQVRFNAWDYSDEHLWSGLVDHLFRTLAADPAGSSAPADPGAVEAERRALRASLAEQEAEAERLSRGLRVADRAAQPTGFLAWLGSPLYAWVVLTAIRELAREIRTSPWILSSWAASS
jgi:hypothetical protein